MSYKIYTKNGDLGFTSLFGGKKVSKADIRIDAYGTIDELNSYLGIVISLVTNQAIVDDLFRVQRVLFNVGTILATNPDKANLMPDFDEKEITFLEEKIDSMEEKLEPLTNFILPSGSLSIAHTHVARTICRRAERRIVEINSIDNRYAKVVKYTNRLSDYLFVLARYIAMEEGIKEVKV